MTLELIQGKVKEKRGLIEIIEDALKSEDLRFQQEPEKPVIRIGAKGKNADFSGLFIVSEEVQIIMFFVNVMPKIPEGRLIEATEFLNRANYGLRIGNFEMDMADGEVRYRVGIDIEDGRLSKAMVINMLKAAFSTADRYYPALMSVCFGNTIPVEAIQHAENQL